MKTKDGQHVRLTVRLTPAQDQKVKKWSKKLGISINQIIRNLVDDFQK